MSSNNRTLGQADEVKTFDTIDMPLPVVKKPPSAAAGSKSGSAGASAAGATAGGGIRGHKPPIGKVHPSKEESKIWTGFTPSALKLDGGQPDAVSMALARTQNNPAATSAEAHKKEANATSNTMKTVNMTDQLDIPESEGARLTDLTAFVKNTYSSDPTMDELRNYLVLMDEYSLHNFVVYQGNTLRDTPEFQSFRRAYLHSWGAISYIIDEIEAFLTKYEVKLAVVDGPKVYHLSTLGLSSYSRDDLLQCIANEEQVKPYLKAINIMNSTGDNRQHRAATLIQSVGRRYNAGKRVKALRRMRDSATKLQSIVRLFLFKNLSRGLLFKRDRQRLEKLRAAQDERLRQWWIHANDFASDLGLSGALGEGTSPELPAISRPVSGATRTAPELDTLLPAAVRNNPRTRLLVVVPSVNTPEYLRLEMDCFAALENTHISLLYQLADPDVHILYVSPCLVGPTESSYHEKLLSILGISTLPKRLHFIVPELLNTLPSHLSLAHMLLCSTAALKRIKNYMKRFNNVMLLPTSVGWAERRLADNLNIPILAPDTAVSISLNSKSFSKRVFMEASMNIPLGAHDIFNLEDLYIALSRLIATNLDVKRWLVKLNYDYNNESLSYIEVDKIKLIQDLRGEQQMLIDMNSGNPSAWFEKSIQLAARRRLVEYLQKDFPSRLSIGRKDIYNSFEKYMQYVSRYGAVVESEPIDTLGYVDGLMFIDPLGGVQYCGSVDQCLDERYQSVGIVYPQEVVPEMALQGATSAIGRHLFDKFKAIGYFTVRYVAFWDSLDELPRLWAIGLYSGMSTSFSCIGTATILSHERPGCVLSKALMPMPTSLVAGRHVVYIPITFHSPLKGTRDDIFFKLCKLRGVSFDADRKIGILFYLIDAVVGGAVSIYCIANTKKKAIGMAVHVLTFISQNFGKADGEERKTAEQLLNVYLRLRQRLRRENKEEVSYGRKK